MLLISIVAWIVGFFSLAVSVKNGFLRKYPDYADHPCNRPCKKGENMRCHYVLNIQFYFTNMPDCLNCQNGSATDCERTDCIIADGNSKLIKVFNGKLPGPSIEVCQGDDLVVDIENMFDAESTSIHWHGFHQVGRPWMDGVPMVSHCPIPPMTTFRYSFKALNHGTHFYHSHIGNQRSDGAYGHLIVRQSPEDNSFSNLYDFDKSEHVISVVDWFLKESNIHFYNLPRNKIRFEGVVSSILINGIGATINNNIKPKIFSVKQGKNYRFRLIHGGFLSCPIKFSIEDHKLTVISSDGADFKPTTVDSLTITNGERYDFIVNAEKEIAEYKMQFSGSVICAHFNTTAILQYEGAKSKEIGFKNVLPKEHTEINCIDVNKKCVNLHDLRSVEKMDPIFKSKPCAKEYIAVDIIHSVLDRYKGYRDNELNSVFINNITYLSSSYPFSLFPNRTNKNACNSHQKKNCKEDLCHCTHILEVPDKCVVELILVDLATKLHLNHPMHLHGYQFRVLGQEKVDKKVTLDQIKEMDIKGLLRRNFEDPISKDTVSVPNGGYTIIRFLTYNPGYWLLHCHVEFHAEQGMQMVLKVGTKLPTPPNDFPKCDDYLVENH